ncbi:MAG: metallophosphoesterase [Clostridia bacterium]|nr:metallophosphoesterase [Clostridia bacterium]
MKVLVVSDTHGDVLSLRKAINQKPLAEVVIHCGDGNSDLEDLKPLYPEKHFIGVRGNCDFCVNAENTETITLEGKKLFITHGHLYNAKYGLYNLVCAARENEADLLLFGHTHNALKDYDDGLYIVNPGSCHGYGASYAYLDITEQGIMVSHFKL